MVPPPNLNLVLVTVDTARVDSFRSFGGDDAHTPNFDQLARDGVKFSDVSVCTPLTLPSHYTIMTSTWPWTHGVVQNGKGSVHPELTTLAEALHTSGFSTRAIVASFVLKRMFGLAHGFDDYNQTMPSIGEHRAALERGAADVADTAIQALDQLQGSRFFLWVHFYDAHFPYKSKKGHSNDSRNAYLEEITLVDQHFGRIVKALQHLGLTEHTLLAVLGDHGEALGDHGELEHGCLLYEPTIRVPMILSGPGFIEEQKVVTKPVRTLDVAPTLLDYLDIEKPAPFQGQSLRPLIEGSNKNWNPVSLAQTSVAHRDLGMASLTSLREGDWKYIRGGREQLYNVTVDPLETNDLTAEEGERATRLSRHLDALLGEDAVGRSGPSKGSIDPETAQALQALGYAGASVEEYSNSQSLKAGGADPALHMEVVEQYSAAVRAIALGDLERALRLLSEIVPAIPDAPAPINQLSRLYRQLGRVDEILTACREFLREDPTAGSIRLFYARQLLRRKLFSEGISELEVVLEYDPGSLEARLECGNAYRAVQDWNSARFHFEQVRTIEPDHVGALLGLAKIDLAKGHPETAYDLLEWAYEIEPRPDVEKLLKRALKEGGRQ
ncbi:MAG: sulfatase-like hydrolase/transferase [Acidobacteriota bacterium]